ncbi:hypothetical protein LTS18_014654, partial [Coniosporium uncinatum]
VLERCEVKFGPYQDVSTPKTPLQHVPEEEAEQEQAVQQMSPTSPTQNHHTLHHTTNTTTSPTYHAYTTAMGSTTNTNGNSSAFPPPPRKTSDANPPPPQSAADFSVWRHRVPSVASTTTSPSGQPRAGSSNSTTTGASPSDLFGGVDALIRDSHDWWLRDQNSLALGFGNWGLPPTTTAAAAQDDNIWVNGVGQSGAVQAPGGLGLGYASPLASGMGNGISGLGNAMSGMGGGGGGGNGIGVMNGVNGMHAGGGQNRFGFGGGVSGYNEEEWYQ